MVEHRLPHDLMAAQRARELTRHWLSERVRDDRLGDIELMVTELVTNAVRHAPPEPDGTVILRLEADESKARAVVIDGGQVFEFERATFDGRSAHFGLQLVDRMASRWGLSLDGEKAVWFELDLER